MERTVRNAAKELIIKDDKMLEVKNSDGKEEWYIMPGVVKMKRNFFRTWYAEK